MEILIANLALLAAQYAGQAIAAKAAQDRQARQQHLDAMESLQQQIAAIHVDATKLVAGDQAGDVHGPADGAGEVKG